MKAPRDHGGGIDAAVARWGGGRDDWLDLSTGINPVPWPLPDLPPRVWTDLPDRAAQRALLAAARTFWEVPDSARILAAPGTSALIAHLPHCLPQGDGRVQIRPDTYNEHAAAFAAAGWSVTDRPAATRVIVTPNNPTGEFPPLDHPGTAVLDESFCDTAPARSGVAGLGAQWVVLKSFGKFWGLAGLRLGFAIGAPDLIESLAERLGPWPVSGPALHIGTTALRDTGWAAAARRRLHEDAARLDALLRAAGLSPRGACPLFRLCEVEDATAWADRLARHRILTRVFPYNPRWLRLGLPPAPGWARLERALAPDGRVGGAMAQPSAGQPE